VNLIRKEKIIPVRWVREHHDADWDGVPDCKDCQPLNPNKQDSGPYGIFQVGRDTYGVFAQQLMGASYIKRGKPFFVGTKYDCQKFMEQIPVNPENYDAEVSQYQR
jgi:hypothetical protein